MIEITPLPSPSRMKELALEEKEREISKEIKDIIELQLKQIKEAMKKGKNSCSWIAFEEFNVNYRIVRTYYIEAETEVRKIFAEAGYTVTKEMIIWEV